jgi:hypothetical protein
VADDEPQAVPPVVRITLAVYVQPVPFICVKSEAPPVGGESVHEHWLFDDRNYPVVKSTVEHLAHVLGHLTVWRHQEAAAKWN